MNLMIAVTTGKSHVRFGDPVLATVTLLRGKWRTPSAIIKPSQTEFHMWLDQIA